ncbi:uncharacterized protein LOC133816360 [Humulus lupulus]|uniref:uncharacterized protein LOC133816360 n=1 Tax=Humulus lupulus TaxID=3486 RepID=UPI002B4104F3|nr:uncharacterized protein LOC133816360 [Humulus lupulus]
MGATMKTLETQVEKLTNTMKNQMSISFPSGRENKSKVCNVIALRSGKELEVSSVEKENVEEISKKNENEEGKAKKDTLKKEPSMAIDEQFKMFLNIFKKIHIKISFVDALVNYAKFMKDVISKKRKLEDYEAVKLTEVCSAIIKRQLPEKLKELGSFTIPCVIGEIHIEKPMCDLGASINLMPLSIF